MELFASQEVASFQMELSYSNYSRQPLNHFFKRFESIEVMRIVSLEKPIPSSQGPYD